MSAASFKIARNTFVDFATLPEIQKELSIQKLYNIYQQTAHGNDYETFRARLLEKNYTKLYLHVMQNSDGEWIGYGITRCVILQYPPTSTRIEDTYAIFRASVAIMEAYRGQKSVDVGMSEAMNCFHTTHPNINIIGYNVTLHPLSYSALLKSSPITYPSPTQPTPDTVLQLLPYLAEIFGYELIDKSPYVTQGSNHSKMSQTEKEKYLHDHKQPLSTQFFCQQTNLTPGHALACFSSYHLVAGNSLKLEPTTEWSYGKYKHLLSNEFLKPLI